MLSLPQKHALVISSSQGELVLVSVTREGYTELGRFSAVEGKARNGPVLAGGQLFFRGAEEMAAFEITAAQTTSGEGVKIGR